MAVILLQIVMVSPRTHLVNKSWVPLQNHWLPFQKITSPTLKMLGPLCDQIVKIYSFVNHTENQKKYAWLNNRHKNSHRNHTNRICLQKHPQIDQLINICILRDACHELLCIFGDFYASGTQDAELTKLYCYDWLFLGLLVKQETRPFW